MGGNGYLLSGGQVSELWLSVVRDRHTDPEYRAFASVERAVEWTRQRFAELVLHPDAIEEDEIDGWALALSYGEDGDAAEVVPLKVDE